MNILLHDDNDEDGNHAAEVSVAPSIISKRQRNAHLHQDEKEAEHDDGAEIDPEEIEALRRVKANLIAMSQKRHHTNVSEKTSHGEDNDDEEEDTRDRAKKAALLAELKPFDLFISLPPAVWAIPFMTVSEYLEAVVNEDEDLLDLPEMLSNLDFAPSDAPNPPSSPSCSSSSSS